MSIRNRYMFIKRTYPSTIVIFKKEHKYKSYGKYKEFLEYLKFHKLNDLNKLNINYIVIGDMTILEYKTFANNNFNIYYSKFNLFKLFNQIRQRRR